VAVGCAIAHAPDIVYADGLDLARARVGIGLSCRLCERPDCRSRAFPPLEHRLALDPLTTSASPYRFEPSPARSEKEGPASGTRGARLETSRAGDAR
jgi:Short-chain fatty acyl coenzyme A regulators